MNDPRLYSLELSIAKLLRLGVLIAGSVLLVAWLGLLTADSSPFERFHEYRQVSLNDTLENAWITGAWASLLAYAGLFILVVLPSLRVLFTAVLFIKSGEYRLAAIAFFVLAVLLVSFTLGIESA